MRCGAARAASPLFEFTSDVADVWMHELEPRLRAGPLEIVGHTSAATLFCLELLARDYGARTVQPLGESTVSFVISRRARRERARAVRGSPQWSKVEQCRDHRPESTERDFQAALRDLTAVVGRDWLFSSDEDVLLYRDGYSPLWGEAEERMASAAVAPNSVEQVQGIVKVANQYGLPLYPISTGAT